MHFVYEVKGSIDIFDGRSHGIDGGGAKSAGDTACSVADTADADTTGTAAESNKSAAESDESADDTANSADSNTNDRAAGNYAERTNRQSEHGDSANADTECRNFGRHRARRTARRSAAGRARFSSSGASAAIG